MRKMRLGKAEKASHRVVRSGARSQLGAHLCPGPGRAHPGPSPADASRALWKEGARTSSQVAWGPRHRQGIMGGDEYRPRVGMGAFI